MDEPSLPDNTRQQLSVYQLPQIPNLYVLSVGVVHAANRHVGHVHERDVRRSQVLRAMLGIQQGRATGNVIVEM